MKQRHISYFFIALFLVFSTYKIKAQSTEVTGTVIDVGSKNTLPGVNILLKGTDKGTSSDAEGNFSIQVASLQDTLIFSFVGYQTTQIPINGRTTLSVALHQRTFQGEEMVVVGYGTQRKSDLTGSISSIRSDEFQDGVSTSVDQLIGNNVAGVRMVSSSSQPGSGAEINIRGASSINAGT